MFRALLRPAASRASTSSVPTLARGLRATTPALASSSIPIADLHALGQKVLSAQGFTSEESAVMLDTMMWSTLRGGASGGLDDLASGAFANTGSPAAAPSVEYETKLSARVDGQQRSGMLVMHKAVNEAVSKAQQHGVGLVGMRNVGSTTGSVGYYLETIANSGLIGLVFSSSSSGGGGGGPSPLGISVPSPRGPVVLDMATAAASVLKLPGPPSADAGLSGALAVFDHSYKGSHLSVMVELLAGPLVGADATAASSLVLAFDPELLGDREAFFRDVEAVLQRNQQASSYPGEAQSLVYNATLQQGQVTLDDKLLTALRAIAAAGPGGALAGGAPAAMGDDYRAAYGIATRLAHPKGKGKGDPFNASSPVLYQTATFELDSVSMSGEYDYTRSGNPTRHMLEEQMAELEGAAKSFAFTSGMGALAVAMRLVPAGGHIVTGDDIYGGTSRLLSKVAPDSGVSVTNVDMTDLNAVKAAMRPNTKLVWMESPTNPRLQVNDIKALANIAKGHGAISMIDNSIMAPVFQKPLELGVDICMTSATKFIAGHSDVTAGILSVADEELAKRVYFLQNSEGGGLSPFDCWLCLRGLKTMSIRMERQQSNAMAMAKWLQSHPAVTKINYPGLPSDPNYQLHQQQAFGPGSLLSFETGNVDLSKGLMEHSKLFKVTVSFGSTTSLLSLPCFMSHASIPPETRRERGLPDDLVRISAGIEDEKDLIADLEQAMEKACAQAGVRLPMATPQQQNFQMGGAAPGFAPSFGRKL